MIQWRRRAQQVVLALYACAILGVVAMVAGPALNDWLIMRDPGRGMGTITGVSAVRTAVEYQDEAGRLHSPPAGLLYPTGLEEGQRVWVTYAKQDPNLVKVEGRGWALSLLPAGSVFVVATLVAAGLWKLVGRLTPEPEALPVKGGAS